MPEPSWRPRRPLRPLPQIDPAQRRVLDGWVRVAGGVVVVHAALLLTLWARPGRIALWIWYAGPIVLAVVTAGLLVASLRSARRWKHGMNGWHVLGYVGLVTGACFAETGVSVICVDIDRGKVERLQRGKLHIHEPGLEDLVRRNLESGRLRFSADVREAVQHGEAQFIAVSTPPGGNGEADLRQVNSVADSIAAHMPAYRLVVCKSTVPVGTGEKVEALQPCAPPHSPLTRN